MAHCVAVADGNLTAAGTWGVSDVGTLIPLVSNSTGSTALTTGNLDSAAFIPTAVAMIGLCIRLAARAAGSPSNTMTVTLRNSTTATDIKSVTVNVSDLPAATAGANSEGGWHFLVFDSSHTPNGTDSYVVRATLSATTTAVSLATNGTANNWQRILVRSTTAAPAAGDDMHLAQQFNGSANPATLTARTVTMDSVAATDYGSADTVNVVSALGISKGGTLTWGTAAATAYILRLSGHLKIYSGGLMNMGTVATPCPRDSSMQLEFDCAADWNFYLSVMNGGTFVGQGLSRTSGKNVTKALTTADVAAGATTINIDADTGWLSGDEVYISGSNRTIGSAEGRVLNGAAGASSFAVTVATTNAHPYSAAEGVAAEVMLFTRNVRIKAVTSTLATGFVVRPTGNIDLDWVSFQSCGATGGQGDHGIILETTTGVVSLHFCSMKDLDEGALALTGVVTTGGSVTIDDLVVMRFAVANGGSGITLETNPAVAGVVAISNVWVTHQTATMAAFFIVGVPNISFSGNFYVSGVSTGLRIEGAWAGGTFGGNWNLHTGNNDLLSNAAAWTDCTLTGTFRLWRTSGSSGVNLQAATTNIRFSGIVYCFGNATAGLASANSIVVVGLRFADLRCYGETGFAQGRGIWFGTGHTLGLFVETGIFGTASGLWTTHGTADVQHDGRLQAIFRNSVFASATEFSPSTIAQFTTRRQVQRKDGTAGVDFTQVFEGTVARETSTVQDSPGAKLTPLSATIKLETATGLPGRGFLVGVLSGGTVQVAVYVRKNATYNGAAPRLIQKNNSAIGATADVVLDTLSVGADTWEILTGTTGAATADGVIEFVVDCDGTAGDVFVNQWTSGSATPSGDETAWHDGLPVRAQGISVIGGAGGEQAFGFVG